MNDELHVIFGSGPVGKSTARALVEMGKRVRAVNRSGRVADLPADVEVVAGDAYDPAATTHLSQNAAAVYQCAQPEYHEWPQKFPPLQAAILQGAIANGAKLIVVENLYAYGDTDGRPMTENTPLAPNTRKGRVRAAMSQTIMEAHHTGKVRAVIGRASNFIGPEYLLIGDLIVYPALAGKTASGMGNLDVPHSFTYVPDFGRALALLGTRDEASGQVWHVPNPPLITQRDLLAMMFAEAGHTLKIRSIGRTMMRLAGLVSPGARETVEMMYEWEKPFIVDSSKFERAFGMQVTPIVEAIRTTLDWFRQRQHSSNGKR